MAQYGNGYRHSWTVGEPAGPTFISKAGHTNGNGVIFWVVVLMVFAIAAMAITVAATLPAM